MRTPTARWLAGAVAGAGYGVFLSVTAMRLPAGAELTGQFGLQPAVKAVPIWWAYAVSQVLITAGFFFGRAVSGPGEEHRGVSACSARPSV
jgi:uncharacterized membrane protein YhhN